MNPGNEQKRTREIFGELGAGLLLFVGTVLFFNYLPHLIGHFGGKALADLGKATGLAWLPWTVLGVIAFFALRPIWKKK